MLYAIQWRDPVTHTLKVQTGQSIPDALHRANMWSGIHFLNGDNKVYGIMDRNGEFVRVPELDEPGHYTPKDLEEKLRKYYNGGDIDEDSGR